MQIIYLASLLAAAQAVPLYKRVYQQTSPMFSLIAEGTEEDTPLKGELVKFDGDQLKLLTDDDAFVGRIKALTGYVLNVPGTLGKAPSQTNLQVDSEGQLKAASGNDKSTQNFALSKSQLVQAKNNKFRVCPDLNDGQKWDEEKWRDFEYSIYTGDSSCPDDTKGIEVVLHSQIDATINYSSDTNVQKVKRWIQNKWNRL